MCGQESQSSLVGIPPGPGCCRGMAPLFLLRCGPRGGWFWERRSCCSCRLWCSPSGPRSPYQGIPKHPKISQQGERNSHLNYSKTPSLNLTFTNFVTCTNTNKSLDSLSLELYWEGEISLCVPSLSTAAVEGLVQSPPGVNNATACCRGEGGSAQGGFVHCHSERALPCWSCNKRANKPTQPNPKVLWQQKAAPAVGVCELPVVRGGRVKGALCWH